MDNRDRKNWVSEKFKEKFGSAPDVWSRAPGRVDLMGSHTDYNLGFVMTLSIDRDTWIAARPRSDRRVAIASLNIEGGGEFDLDHIEHDPIDRWTNYVRGMAKVMQESGYALTGFDGLIHSTVPFGSGLSSSAAIEMATGVLFEQLGGFTIDPVTLALTGQKAENHFVGVNSGILDQYSSAMGQAGCALLLDCKYLTSRAAPIARGVQVVICDTRAKRTLAGTEYDERRAQCEAGVRILQQWYPGISALRDVSLLEFEAHERDLPVVVAKRCRFIIEENQRVLELAEALAHDDETPLQRLTAASYAGARDLYEIGAPSMVAMMQAMLGAPGVIGARQAGAGFGGCMVALVQRSHVEAFAAHVSRAYHAATHIEPQVYAVQAASGAGPLSFHTEATMNSKERVMNRLRGGEVDRVPNFDIMMTFAAHYVQQPLSRYYLDYRVLCEANLAVQHAFDLDIVQVISDPYREAADFGSDIEFPHDGLPLRKQPLLIDPADLSGLKPPDPTSGRRMSDRLAAIRTLHDQVGGEVPVMGWVEGAFAEAADLRGESTLLVDLIERPAWVRDLLDVTVETAIAFARAQIEAGADIIGLGDALASQISPKMYRTFALPYEQRIFKAVRDMGALARLHICGNTTRLLTDMAQTGADIIDLDWMVDMAQAAKTFGDGPVMCGNFDPVRVMLQGTPDQVRQAVGQCLQEGGSRLISGAGCEIPDGTPHVNLHAQSQVLREIIG